MVGTDDGKELVRGRRGLVSLSLSVSGHQPFIVRNNLMVAQYLYPLRNDEEMMMMMGMLALANESREGVVIVEKETGKGRNYIIV